mmetsp:Transcript_87061/g.164114  ORF Transcript_87061/g.164114 Transcript_87061/m.164114 type:complete len:341 (-) Transcript_87061:192-1214(-)
MGKKPDRKAAAKAKQKAAAAPVPAEDEAESAEKLEARRIWQQRKDASKWVQAQLTTVRGQLETAQARKDSDWLQIAHEFHEKGLIKLGKRLEAKELGGLPQEFKDGLESYLSQCAGGKGAEILPENFREEKEVWKLVEEEASSYTRPPETPEAIAVAEQLKTWNGDGVDEMKRFVSIMRTQVESPGVQEAGLVRIGGLCSEAQEKAKGSEAPGLTSATLMPAIELAMTSHLPDPSVQRSGCAALRGLAIADGQLPGLCDAGGVKLAVDGLNAHFKEKEVALAATGAFWAMAKASGKNSPEVNSMIASGVVEALMKVMNHHAWDQTLCGKVRVVLPFITED